MKLIGRVVILFLILGCTDGQGAASQNLASNATITPADLATSSSTCDGAPKETEGFQVPSFALMPGAVAGSSGPDIVIAKVGTPDDRPMRAGDEARFWGAVYRRASRTWHEIAPPPVPLPRAEFLTRVIAGRLLVLWSTKDETWSGFFFDPKTVTWRRVDSSGAPPPASFFARPFREAILDDEWMLFSITDRGVDFSLGRVLDLRTGQWRHANPEDAPTSQSLDANARGPVVQRPKQSGTVRRISGNRVIVVPTGSNRFSVYDARANSWRNTPLPAEVGPSPIVAVSATGESFALLSWTKTRVPGETILRAWIGDAETFEFDEIGSPPAIFAEAYPNPELVAYDGHQIVYIENGRMIRYEIRERRWSVHSTPFAEPLSGRGSLHPICAGRMLFRFIDDWILDSDAQRWTRLVRPDGVPKRGRHEWVRSDHLVQLGERRVERDSTECPPGAPCAAPEERIVDDTRSFLIPIR